MMDCHKIKCSLVLILCFSAVSGLCASTFISDGIFGSTVTSERRLLQAKKPCPVNFEFQNYTIITSQCKGPSYPPSMCCSALKQFACPFSEELNDLSNDCASTMFSYINLYGKYPPGLFASECREGKFGLECSAQSPSSSFESEKVGNNGGSELMLSKFLAMLVAFVVVLIHFV